VSAKFTLSQRLRYRFDAGLSRGIWVVLVWLGALTVVAIVLAAAVMWLLRLGPDDQPTSFANGIWLAFGRYIDAGTFTGDSGSNFRFLAILVTILGLFIGAAIIGLISSGIDSRVEALRRGQSPVVESGHTLILGNSDKLAVIISELVEANRSERGRAIVVLADEDTVDLTEWIRGEVPDLGTSKLVIRRGNPNRLADLTRVNPTGARSVIVLSPESSESSATVVKTVLALSQLLDADSTTSIVAEIEDDDTADALAEAVGSRLVIVNPTKTVARVTAQVSRASGLGAIYEELLDFDGDEMYLKPVPSEWVGRTFAEVLLASSASTIIGIRDAAGLVRLSPGPSTVLGDGDQLIGIAEDDSTFLLDVPPTDWQPNQSRPWIPAERHTERTLIIGWSAMGPLIIREIENHVLPGSELVVLIDDEHQNPVLIESRIASLGLVNQSVRIEIGDTISRRVIGSLVETSPFDHYLLLCERHGFGVDEADARVLLSLMHLRSFESVLDGNIVSELLDPNDVELASKATGDDFIVSQRLVSLLMTQLSESPHLSDVFTDLFDANGPSVSMHAYERFTDSPSITFGELVAEARNWGGVVIGYRADSAIGQPGCLADGLRVNPPKSEVINFTPGDIVVAITPRD
jgi:voltage-gated potassium channel Kch/K+/H+ antiporter YhaU regulatory subunit KhtT